MKRFIATAAALAMMQSAVFAAPLSTDPTANPVLANIQKSGAKIYSLGTRDGLQGWFVVKDGQVQIAYATPDNKGVLVGALFGQDGENLTTLQVGTLLRNNKEVAEVIASAQKEQMAAAATNTSSSAPQTTAATKEVSSAPSSPGERLIHDLSAASTAVIGSNLSSPEVLMVMDPHCIHCQATWKAVRDAVLGGKMHLRMIPIGAQGTDNERAGAMLLSVQDPTNVWDKYVSGDHSVLAGTPSDAAIAAMRANHVVVDNWHIEATPYMAYRSKDGKVKVMQGEPDKVSALFADLGI